MVRHNASGGASGASTLACVTPTGGERDGDLHDRLGYRRPRPVTPGAVRFASAAGRWTIGATVLGSGMAFLDSTVVNVALPAIDHDLGAGLSGLQWTVDAYLLALGALLLLGGSLGDLYGRRRAFVWGLGGFALSSALCGAAPSTAILVVARALQGATAALLVPGSLALISATFHPGDRGRAIGAWSGLSGITTALGPFIGGWLIEAVSWRAVFVINLPLAVVAITVALRYVPESRDETSPRRPDLAGAGLVALALGGIIYALIEGPAAGWTTPSIVAAGALGVVGSIAFVRVEARRANPMLPLGVFRARQFSGANASTFAVYFALSGAMFLVVIQLQRVLGYSAVEAGGALVPITVLLLIMSPRAGQVAGRIGPRLPMTIGPIVAAGGVALMARIQPGAGYFSTVLPAVVVFGIGLGITVAPLTTAVLAALEARRAGIAPGVNNAVARVAGLVAVAVLPLLGGIQGEDAAGFEAGFPRAILIAAAMCAVGGVIAFAYIRKPGEPYALAVPATADHPACQEVT